MAMADYAKCHKCLGKAFYDANISDPAYCATWDPEEDADPIGIAVLCAECNKTWDVAIVPRDLGICEHCQGSGEGVADQVCSTCGGSGADTKRN